MIKGIIKITFFLLLAAQVRAKALPVPTLDGLSYKNFHQEILPFIKELEENCSSRRPGDVNEKALLLMEDACLLERIIDELSIRQDKINEFLSYDLKVSNNFRPIDLRYGWVSKHEFSFKVGMENEIIEYFILQEAFKKSIEALSKLWELWHGQASLVGRYLLISKFSGVFEKDLFVARINYFSKGILCYQDTIQGLRYPETECLKNRNEMAFLSNYLISAAKAQVPERLNSIVSYISESSGDYLKRSNEFNSLLESAFAQSRSVNQLVNWMRSESEDLKNIKQKYRYLLRTVKMLEDNQINLMVDTLNLYRRLMALELSPVEEGAVINMSIVHSSQRLNTIYTRAKKQLVEKLYLKIPNE